MEKLKKYILLSIAIIVVIIIIIISILLYKFKRKENNENSENNDDGQYVVDDTFEHTGKSHSIHLLTDTDRFYTIENCINIYLEKVCNKDKKAINNILEKTNKNTNITYNTQKENISYKIWAVDIDDNISKYYVYTKIRDKNSIDITNEQNYYFTVILDTKNTTFSIIPQGEEYNENDLNAIKNYSSKEIIPNDSNKYSNIVIYNKDIVIKYFEEYRKNALYNVEKAYELLDEDYRNKKFGSINEFEEYVINNKSVILNAILIQYLKEQFDGYVQYTLIDNYNNCYIIKEKNVMDFSIQLDNYTIETEELSSEYENASIEVKISSNIDKLFKMINNKEYKKIYNEYLNQDIIIIVTIMTL